MQSKFLKKPQKPREALSDVVPDIVKKAVSEAKTDSTTKSTRRVTLSLGEKYYQAIMKKIANTKRANRTSTIEDLLDESGFMEKWGE